MTVNDLTLMPLDDLRRYMLTHRDDVLAFQVYVDRSKATGRMITIDPADPNWEDALQVRLQQNNDS
jgi:hypothetical protein